MHFGAEDSVVLLGLLVAGAALLAIAQVVRVPYPILLVLGGLALGFAPGMPTIELSPDLVLVAFLPPLLYGAAFFTPLRELRANAGSISTLAVGLVLATTVAVAVVAHAVIPELTWPTAFVLGAIVSPTDPTAATAIAQRLGLPRRLIAIIEGESLVNDGTALVVYRVAVVAVVTGSFSLASASASFVLNVIGGILVGLAAGIVIRQVRRRLNNPPVEITISILSGYFAYLPAHALDVSGVLAAVTVGVYMGWYTPELTTSQTRLQGQAVWEIVFLGLNAVLFALVGLQLPAILDELSVARSTGELIGYAALVTAVVVLVRFAWVVVAAYMPRMMRANGSPPWKGAVVLSWSGMRGAVSLAAALALPLTTDADAAFPNRDLIVFLTFGVILGTLVVQGLTLPGRIRAAEAALARLDELVDEDWVNADTAERMRGLYGFRRDRFRSRFDPESDGAIEGQSLSYQRLRRELLEAERQELRRLRLEGRIDDDVVRRVQRDLDLENERLDI